MAQREIDYRFKFLYAIAIILVVDGHCGGGAIDLSFGGWFSNYGAHLPIFMFSSGYFYARRVSINVRDGGGTS